MGNIPVGYRMHMAQNPDRSVTWDGTLEPDPDWAPTIRTIFTEYAEGARIIDIVDALNETRPGPAGGAWHRNRVERMLRNPVYKGLLVRYRYKSADHYYEESDPIDGRQVIGQCEPLVDPEALWDRAQQRHHPKRRRVKRRRASAPEQLSMAV